MLTLCTIAVVMIVIATFMEIIWGRSKKLGYNTGCLVVFLGGIQLFFLGIIGVYLSKIYTEVKQRPIYIIKEDNLK